MTGIKQLFLIFFFSFFIGLSAQATSIVDLSNGSSVTSNPDTLFYQAFTPRQNNLSQIDVTCYDTGGVNRSFVIEVYSGDIGSGDIVGFANTNVINCDTNNHVANAIFTTPLPLVVGFPYYFIQRAFSGATFSINLIYWNSIQNSVSSVGGMFDGFRYSNLTNPDVRAMGAVKTYYSDTYTGLPATSSVNILYPTASATYNSSPLPIAFSYDNQAGTYSQIVFNISRVSPDAQTMTPVHFFTTTTATTTHKIVFKNLVNGNYNINAYLTNWNGTPHPAPTATINFNIASSTYDDGSADLIPIDLPNVIPETCLFDISECESIDGLNFYAGATCGLKKFAIWALCPDQNALDSINTSYSDIKNSFPFNAFFDLTTAVNSAVATSTNLNETFKMPFITATGTFYMLPVLSSTSLPNLIGNTNATLFRNSLTWIFWALAGFIVFITFKKI